MPGVICKVDNVTRLEVPTPFFLRDKPFTGFNSPNYNWEEVKKVTLLVQTKPKTIPRVFKNGAVEEITDEVSGCPLECPFDPNENFDSNILDVVPKTSFPGLEFSLDIYEPVCLDGGSKIIKDIYLENPRVIKNLGLYRGTSKSEPSPVYMACIPNSKAQEDDLVLIGFFKEHFMEVRMTGPYDPDRLFKIDLFVSYHQHLPDVGKSPITKKVHAIYEKIHGDFKSDGKVFMEFVWSEPKAIFELPPATKAKAKLAIHPRPGDANPFLKEFWEEISALDALLELREQAGHEMNKTQLLLRSYQEAPDMSVVDELKKFLKLPSTPAWGRGRDLTSFLIPVIQRVLNGDRTDVDFTDAAWPILKKVSSIIEAMECCNQILTSFENKLFRPYLYPTNTTLFGHLTKEMTAGNLKNFRTKFNPLLAIDLIIDMGMNKIFRDFSFILKTCAIAQPESLETYKPQFKDFRNSVNNLKKIHYLLEILSLSNERLAITGSDLEYQAQAVLKYFETKPLDWEHTFHFDIHMGLISNSLTGMKPIYWNMQLDSSTSLKKVRTNAILSRDIFLRHGAKALNLLASDIARARGYYLYVHRITEREKEGDESED